MSVPRHPVAAGRANLETALLAEDLLNVVSDILEGKLLGILNSGRVAATAITGQMGPSQGGTGNARGEATPLDGSVTDAKVSVTANIQPSKLNQILLKTLVYTLAKVMLLGSTDITVTANDLLQTLTWSIPTLDKSLDDLTDVIITDPQPGDTIVAFLEGGNIIWRNVHGLASEDGGLYISGDLLTVGGAILTVGD
jgi:hypothetical protein